MPTLTPLQALKTLAHKLKLQEFPECEDARVLEAFLYLRARIKVLQRDAEVPASSSEDILGERNDEFEFLELVLARLRTYVDLPRPLGPMEMVSAMSALQFVARRLAIPHTEWKFEEDDLPGSVELVVDSR